VTKISAALALSCALTSFPSISHADTFGSGENKFDIEFVAVGNPNNDDDFSGNPSPAGKVEYRYRIGKFEVSEDMIDKANTLGGLEITKDTRSPHKPATNVSWLEAARFVNWLNTSTGNPLAYKFDDDGSFQLWQPGDAGYDPNNLYRNRHARYFLPSADEWYKAAYYDPTASLYYRYPTGSSATPTPVASGTAPGTAVYHFAATEPADIMLAGGLSPYGTMAQGGNVWEWEETDLDLVNDSTTSERGISGGYWGNISGALSSTALAAC